MRILRCIGTAALLLLFACQPNAQLLEESTLSSELPANAGRQEDAREALQSGLPSRKIVFRQADGTPDFSLQFKPTGGKLINRKGKVIANFVLKGDRTIQLTNAQSKTIGYVARTQNTWQIENSKRSKTLFTFRREPDGSAALFQDDKLDDSAAVYKLSVTEEGYAVASGKSEQYVVNLEKGVGKLQANDGTTVVAADSEIKPIALASFGFAELTQAQQAGLAYALSANVL